MLEAMEMPTPCPWCRRVVELNDMNTCAFCGELKCDQCCKQNQGDCADCQATYRCEYVPEKGPNADIECGKYGPNKIEDIRCCNRHFRIIERRLGL